MTAGDMFIRWLSLLFCFNPSCANGFGEEFGELEEVEMLILALDGSVRSELASLFANRVEESCEAEDAFSFGVEAPSGGGGPPEPSFASLLLRIYKGTLQLWGHET